VTGAAQWREILERFRTEAVIGVMMQIVTTQLPFFLTDRTRWLPDKPHPVFLKPPGTDRPPCIRAHVGVIAGAMFVPLGGLPGVLAEGPHRS